MVTIALDVHTKKTQLCVSNQQGVILLEKVVVPDQIEVVCVPKLRRQ